MFEMTSQRVWLAAHEDRYYPVVGWVQDERPQVWPLVLRAGRIVDAAGSVVYTTQAVWLRVMAQASEGVTMEWIIERGNKDATAERVARQGGQLQDRITDVLTSAGYPMKAGDVARKLEANSGSVSRALRVMVDRGALRQIADRYRPA